MGACSQTIAVSTPCEASAVANAGAASAWLQRVRSTTRSGASANVPSFRLQGSSERVSGSNDDPGKTDARLPVDSHVWLADGMWRREPAGCRTPAASPRARSVRRVR